MPRSLYDETVRAEVVARLDRLQPSAAARWGRMDAPKMVAHVTEWFRMSNGDLSVRVRRVPGRTLLRWLIIYVLPMPKGSPTARELIARVPESWPQDVARLRALLEAQRRRQPARPVPDHPLFGPMREDDWGVLAWKHTDHHFRQFGI